MCLCWRNDLNMLEADNMSNLSTESTDDANIQMTHARLIVFDLDETLITHTVNKEADPSADMSIELSETEVINVWKRPQIDAVLDYAFAHFDVGIFSFANELYIYPILTTLWSRRNFAFVYCKDKCEHMRYRGKWITVKPLRKIWESAAGLTSNWSQQNTIVFDDVASTAVLNLKNLRLVAPFRCYNKYDTEALVMLEHLRAHSGESASGSGSP